MRPDAVREWIVGAARPETTASSRWPRRPRQAQPDLRPRHQQRRPHPGASTTTTCATWRLIRDRVEPQDARAGARPETWYTA
ncbi:MAG: hypothetical protein MZV65_43915 [Chromatiales bacterium]|nr:hypothetical protein [Chromatiales bacterium]